MDESTKTPFTSVSSGISSHCCLFGIIATRGGGCNRSSFVVVAKRNRLRKKEEKNKRERIKLQFNNYFISYMYGYRPCEERRPTTSSHHHTVYDPAQLRLSRNYILLRYSQGSLLCVPKLVSLSCHPIEMIIKIANQGSLLETRILSPSNKIQTLYVPIKL